MKTIFKFGLLLLAGIYGAGYYFLGEGGINRFLDRSIEMSKQGNAQGLCDTLADDMTVAILDHTAKAVPGMGDGKINGGKSEACAYFNMTSSIPMPQNMSFQSSRQISGIEKSWLHPWTVNVTYTEQQTLTVQAGGQSATLGTESNDKLGLVLTLGGVSVKRLESEARLVKPQTRS